MRIIDDKLIVLLGDNHGQYGRIFDRIDQMKISDCILISVGDNGFGFPGFGLNYLDKLNDRFKERGIEFLAIRGNHCDPEFYSSGYSWSNLKPLEDYTTMVINGETWQFVGGAISVDRKYRTPNLDYWKDEIFIFDKDKAVNCDVLITHSAPPWIGPNHKGQFVESFYDKDPTLKQELIDERKLHQDLMDICKPSKHFCGHFHRSETTKYSNQLGYEVTSRILNIEEFIEYKNE
jgi:hypothetical protein